MLLQVALFLSFLRLSNISSFVCVCVCVRVCVCVCVCVSVILSLSIHPLVTLDCLAIISSAAMDTGGHISFRLKSFYLFQPPMAREQ